MKIIERILNYLFLVLVGFYSATLLIDTVCVIIDPESYRTAQGFTEADLSWNSKVILSYIMSNVLLLMIFVFSFYVGIKNIRHKGFFKFWRIHYYVIFIGLFIAIVGGYYYWFSLGFDH